MREWLAHWIVQDFYDPVWPNIAASAVCTIIVWLKLHSIHKHLKGKSDKQHDDV